MGRSLGRARKLDHGDGLAPEITMTFEDPADLVRVLSAERVGSYMQFAKSLRQFRTRRNTRAGSESSQAGCDPPRIVRVS